MAAARSVDEHAHECDHFGADVDADADVGS